MNTGKMREDDSNAQSGAVLLVGLQPDFFSAAGYVSSTDACGVSTRNVLLVAVVREDLLELAVAGGVDALVVPIDGLQLLHERDDRAVVVDRLGPQLFGIFVQGGAVVAHAGSLAVRFWSRGNRAIRQLTTHESPAGSITRR